MLSRLSLANAMDAPYRGDGAQRHPTKQYGAETLYQYPAANSQVSLSGQMNAPQPPKRTMYPLWWS